MSPSNKNHTVTAERHRHDCISSDLDGELNIGLVMANGTVHAAAPLAIRAGGICLQWPPEEMVLLNIGEEAEFRIQHGAVDDPLTIRAVVRRPETDPGGNVRYGFEFLDAGHLFGHISLALSGLFNRRKLPRQGWNPRPGITAAESQRA